MNTSINTAGLKQADTMIKFMAGLKELPNATLKERLQVGLADYVDTFTNEEMEQIRQALKKLTWETDTRFHQQAAHYLLDNVFLKMESGSGMHFLIAEAIGRLNEGEFVPQPGEREKEARL